MTRHDKKASSKQVYRYSEAFKHRVVSELESGTQSIEQIRHKYGIKGSSTIQKWVKKLGKNDLLCKVVRIETPQEMDQTKALRQRIRELESALAQTQMHNLQNESYLHLACQALGVEVDVFKKKPISKPPLADATSAPTGSDAEPE